MYISIFKPTKQQLFTKDIYGFDIETCDKNKSFVLAVCYDGNKFYEFYKKRDLIEFFKQKRFKNSFVSATNLSFDFAGTFFKQPEMKEFNMLWRGSDLIFTKTYIENKKFHQKRLKNNSQATTFIDTWNYAKFSVEKAGKILKLPKFDKPTFLGQMYKNEKERKELVTYCKRDAEISQKFISFLFNSFTKIGATPKLTIASTSMSLYKNKYLKDEYLTHDSDTCLDLFNAYYGGNCHAYSRGTIKKYNYYDFNSLYPSVMINEFPDPKTIRSNNKNSIFYIENFEGIAKVTVYCPYMEFPLLPYRTETKLLFPYGTFTGWYSNIELRRALELGYTILKVHKNYFFKGTCRPFDNFVNDMYTLRKQYQKDENPMEYVVKILMNSLYGKFGQKFLNKENLVPFNHTLEELAKLDYFERVGDFIRIKTSWSRPAAFCIPEWALYVTAYGRIKLHDYILKSHPVYVDTDSLITKKEFHSSNKLGGLKLENFVKSGVIVKPKFYMINSKCKVKGMGVKVTPLNFIKFLNNPSMTYDKFMKFKESIRRGFIPNEIQEMTKTMSLEDDKRFWGKEYDYKDFQISKPLEIKNGVVYREEKESISLKTEIFK